MDITKKTNFVVRTELLNDYLNDISKLPVITAQEEKDLFAKMENASEEERIAIRNQIINGNQRFVYALAKRYATGDLLPDLINVGNMGMIDAFEQYDWKTGNRFSTLAEYYVRRAINGYLVKENLMVRPTNNVRFAPKIKKIKAEFLNKYNREPETFEIIDILKEKYNINVKDEGDIAGVKIDYINSAASDDEDFTFENSAIFNEKTAMDNEYETQIEEESLSYAMNEALKVLSERERTIMKMHAGVGYLKEYKDKEIAETLGLTSERVRQLRHGAEEKMRGAYIAANA